MNHGNVPISRLPEKWFQYATNHYTSRFEVTGASSLVGRVGITTISEEEDAEHDIRVALGVGLSCPLHISMKVGSSNPRVLSDMGLAIFFYLAHHYFESIKKWREEVMQPAAGPSSVVLLVQHLV